MSETTPAHESIEAVETEIDAPAPEGFDLAAWIAGVQPTIRSCTLYQRADLLARIEELEQRLQIAEKAATEDESLAGGSAVSQLNGELEAAYQEFVDSAITFRVQGRSADWLTETEKRVKKSAEANGMTDEQKAQLVTRHELAESIVEPAGVTTDMLATLEQVTGAQYRKLVSAFFQACSQAPSVSVPFSRSSSDSRGGRKS